MSSLHRDDEEHAVTQESRKYRDPYAMWDLGTVCFYCREGLTVGGRDFP